VSVVVVSNIVPHEGKGAEVLTLLEAAIPVMQRQPGCELYALHKGRGRARGRFLLLEKWVDDEALERYGRSSELIMLHDQLEPLIESLEDYMIFAPLPFGDGEKGAV
jgi:quinol monooxygenase YgiN